MKTIRCAMCGQASVHGATHQMMQSERFPSVFLHNGDCRHRVFHVLIVDMGLDPKIPLARDLIQDSEIQRLLRHER